MKHIITLLATLTIAMSAYAQTDSLVIIEPKGDGLNLNIAGFSVTLEGNSESQTEKQRYRPYGTYVLSAKWGVTRLTDSPYYGNWADQGDFLNLSGKSNTLSIEPISWEVRLDRKRIVWLKTGLIGTWDNYHFYNPITLVNNDKGYLMPLHLEKDIKRTKMNSFYLGASLGLAFRLGNVKIGANVTPEILCYCETRYRTADKAKYKTEIQGLSPVRVKVGATMMIDWLGIYVDYGLSPVFKEGTGNDARIVSVGLKVGGF